MSHQQASKSQPPPPRPSPIEIILRINTKLNDENQESHSIRKICATVAKELEMPFNTVKRIYFTRRKQDVLGMKAHGNNILTFSEEIALVGILLRHGRQQKHVFVGRIPSIVKELCDKEVDETWAYRFVKRQKKFLKSSKNKTMEKNRSNAEILEAVEVFVEEYAELEEHLGTDFRPQSLITCDESLLNITDGKLQSSRIVSRNSKGEPIDIRPSLYGSILVFVGADGTFWLLALCVKVGEKTHQATVPIPNDERGSRRGNSPLATAQFATESGYFSRQQYEDSVKLLMKTMMDHGVGESMKILLADNLEIHREPSFVRHCLNNLLYICSYAPNCTSFMAPLDNLIFATFKQSMAAKYKELYTQLSFAGHQDEAVKWGIPFLIWSSAEAAFKRRIIIKSFKKTGIYPFKPDLILSNAKKTSSALELPEQRLEDKIASSAIATISTLGVKAQQTLRQMSKKITFSKVGEIGATSQQTGPTKQKERMTPTRKYVQGRLTGPENYLKMASNNVNTQKENTPIMKRKRNQDQEDATVEEGDIPNEPKKKYNPFSAFLNFFTQNNE